MISNNLAFVLFKFELPERALEHMKNSVGYMISFMTTDRILHDLNNHHKLGSDIIHKTRRVLQRLLLVRLQLRLVAFLNILGKFSEALESTRDALTESALMCLDTVTIGLLFSLKLNKTKRSKQLQVLYQEKKTAEQFGDYHDRALKRGENAVLKKLLADAHSSREIATLGDTRSSVIDRERRQVLDKDDQLTLQHLQKWIPISLELKKFIENMNEGMKKHRKILRINKLMEKTKDNLLASLDISYLFSRFPDDHYLFKSSIQEIDRLDLLELKDMDFECDFKIALHQISSQSLVEKISWFVICYFQTANQKECMEMMLAAVANKSKQPEFPITSSRPDNDHRIPDS